MLLSRSEEVRVLPNFHDKWAYCNEAGTINGIAPAHIWVAESVGDHVIGGFEARPTEGCTVPIPGLFFKEPQNPDVPDLVELVIGSQGTL